ncbi:sugar ABC transporter substrate-binding protein [Pseudonocardia sp. GCM10023141]|uniref:sugar ABC transporter substrate-binding protein n=1 Tax=Pseudonocardia sp. GCM10023141 TaxID=3252653 RepID=UPI0036168832
MARRRAVLATVLATVAAIGLSACGGGGAAASGPVTSLRVLDYYNNEPDKTVYAQTLDACGKENGVTIEREAVPGATLIAKVLQQASSKTLPDVLMLDNPDLQQIAATGALAPVSDFGLSAAGYAEGIVNASSYKGAVYGLQPVTNTIGLFYNKDILDKAGVKPPTTWDELKAAAKALTSGPRYGIAFSAAATYEGTWQFLPFMWTGGGDERDIASPQVAQALQLWVDLVSSGSASKSVVTWGQADVNEQFMAGNAAMMINGPWQFPVLKKDPNLHYAVVPIPGPQAGTTPVAPLGGETWTIPRTGNPARQAVAAKIVACLNSDANQMALAQQRTTVPTKTALDAPFVAQVPEMAAFTTAVQTARARTGELGPDWPKAATKIYTAIQTALTGGATPAAALRQAQGG